METSNNYLKPHTIPLKVANNSTSTLRVAGKRSTLEPDDEQQSLLQESLKLIDELFEFRLVQKLSRPTPRQDKEQLVEKFAGKMESLHRKLDRVRNQLADKISYDAPSSKQKSVVGSVTHRPINWRKLIKSIQNRYVEVLYQGSFKYYPKLYTLYFFSYPLHRIKIEQWSMYCLTKKDQQTCC